MSLACHLIRLLAMTIAMIVVGLGVSAVQAHDGHAQPRSAPVHSVHVHSAPVQAGAAAASITAAVATTRAAAMQAGCDGQESCTFCCMACCHSVLMPAAATEPPPPAEPLRVAAPEPAIPPGLAPEALPRPPRPLA